MANQESIPESDRDSQVDTSSKNQRVCLHRPYECETERDLETFSCVVVWFLLLCVNKQLARNESHYVHTHTTMRVAGAQPYELYKLCSLNPEKACTYTDHESTQLCCG